MIKVNRIIKVNKMSFCISCGETIEKTDKFCPYCGIKLQLTSWDRKAFLETLKKTNTPQPRYKQLIKRLKKVIKKQNDQKNDS